MIRYLASILIFLVFITSSTSALEVDSLLGIPVYSTATEIMQQAERDGQKYRLSKFFDGFSIIFEPVDLIWLELPVSRIKIDFPEEDFESVASSIEIAYGEVSMPWDLTPKEKYSKYISDLIQIYDQLNAEYSEPLQASFYTTSSLASEKIEIKNFKKYVTLESCTELMEKNLTVAIFVRFDGVDLDAFMFKSMDQEKLSYKIYYSLINETRGLRNG